MSLSRSVATTVGSALLVSAIMNRVRLHEEHVRRTGPRGTEILLGSDGRPIEYVIDGCVPGTAPLVILENGLGSPLESWDWLVRALRCEYTIIRHHRRGYGRTTSRDSTADAVAALVRALAPAGPIVYVAHSIGALVVAKVLRESASVRNRTKAVVLVDGTDATLLEQSRSSRNALGGYRQLTIQEAIASMTGMNRWTMSKIERDVQYLPDLQRSYLTFVSSPRTLLAAYIEHRDLTGPDVLVDGMTVRVVSAADNSIQQDRFATRIGAECTVIAGSAHRSIIGERRCADELADVIKGIA